MTTYYNERFGSAEVFEGGRPIRRFDLRSMRRVLIAAGVLGIGMVALIEFLLVSPRIVDRDAIRARAASLGEENRRNEATLVEYRQFLERKAAVEREFEVATTSIPTEAELAGVLESIQSVAYDARVKVVSFTPIEPSRGRSSRQPTSSELGQRLVRVVVRGDYPQVRALVTALGGYSRVLTLDRFSARSSDTEYSIEATLEVTCYYKQPVTVDRPRS